ARRLVRAGGKVLIAAAAASTMSHNDSLISVGEIVDLLSGLLVIDDGADRDFQDHAFAVATGAVGAFTVASAFGGIFGIKAEMDQGVVALAGFHDHVAATTTVSAGGSAPGNKFFAAKGHTAIAAAAGLDANDCLIDEHFYF